MYQFYNYLDHYILFVGGPIFVEQLTGTFHSIIKNDLLLRCQAVSDELLDMAYVWTHNGIPLQNSNSEIAGHIVSIINLSIVVLTYNTFKCIPLYSCFDIFV